MENIRITSKSVKYSNLYKLLDYLEVHAVAALYCLSIVYAMTTSLRFSYSPLMLYGALLALLILFHLAFSSRIAVILSSVVLLLSIMFTGLYLDKLYSSDKLLEIIRAFPGWVRDYTSVGAPPIPTYILSLTILICIAVSLPAYFFIISKFNFFIILCSGVYLFVIQWAADIFISYLSFYIFVFSIIIYYFRYIYLKSSSAKNASGIPMSLFSICLIPLCGLILCLSTFLPASEKPIELPWLDKKVIAAINSVKNKFSYQTFDRFSLEYTGFSEDISKLGGKVKKDKTPVLKVDTPKRVYLKGSVKDIFDGTHWKSSSEIKEPLNPYTFDTIDTNSPYFDSMELEAGLFLASSDPYYPNKHIEETSINIRFLNLKTSSLFTPDMISDIKPGDQGSPNIFHNGNGVLYMGKHMGKGFEYNVKMRSIDFSNKEIESLLAQSHRGFIDDAYRWLNQRYNTFISHDGDTYLTKEDSINLFYLRDNQPVLLTNKLIAAMGNNSKEIYSKYLQIPDTLPERVKQLAYLISPITESNYEAVKAIESFLSSNFKYTLSPAATPPDRDFVDYFLFDLGEGYCTYYASAMTILTRCIGIPARYVEGYALPPKRDKDDTYTVTNEQAHAWVEVYFEGFGWLPFEPTSAYNSSGTGSLSSVPSGAGMPYGGFMERFNRMNDHDNKDSYTENNLNNTASSPKEINKINMAAILLSAVLIILVLAYAGIIATNSLRRKARSKKVLNSSPKQSVLFMYGHMIKILSSQGLGLQFGETPLEYSYRIEKYLFPKSSFKRTTEIFLAARYSEVDINETHKAQVYNFYDNFMGEIKSYMGKKSFWIYKNILGKL